MPDPIVVRLAPFELEMAAMVGGRRQNEAFARGLGEKYNGNGQDEKGDAYDRHIVGVAGEIAVARVLDKYWNGSVNTFKVGADVGDSIQVRTRRRSGYDLVVRGNDRDDDYFVLVIEQMPALKVMGWMRGGAAKEERWLQSYGGGARAYFVPATELRPIDMLRKIVDAMREVGVT